MLFVLQKPEVMRFSSCENSAHPGSEGGDSSTCLDFSSDEDLTIPELAQDPLHPERGFGLDPRGIKNICTETERHQTNPGSHQVKNDGQALLCGLQCYLYYYFI